MRRKEKGDPCDDFWLTIAVGLAASLPLLIVLHALLG